MESSKWAIIPPLSSNTVLTPWRSRNLAMYSEPFTRMTPTDSAVAATSPLAPCSLPDIESPATHSLVQALDHITQMGFSQSRIYADPEHLLHHEVGVLQIADLPVRDALIRGLANQVPSKQQPRPNAIRLQTPNDLVARHRSAGAHRQRKTEPARLRARSRFRQNENVLQIL